jgi:hypothetical protein
MTEDLNTDITMRDFGFDDDDDLDAFMKDLNVFLDMMNKIDRINNDILYKDVDDNYLDESCM